LVVKAKNLF